ncbi:MAG: hypothetical protein ACOC9Z_00010 [Chloroflexota bacterium]
MMKTSDSGLIRALFVAGGMVFLLLTAGFFLQMGWATALWPWPVGRLSYIFISSITAAIAAPMIWIGLTREFGAARGGAVNLSITATGAAVYLFILYRREGEIQLLLSALASAFFLAVNVGIFLWSIRHPIRDRRAMPGLVRASFGLFTVVLLLVAGLLVLQAPVVFPWPLQPESSVIFGFIFLGAASYFAIALPSPWWHSARGQLIGFLAYDLILIGPFLAHFGTVEPAHRLSLILYVAVLAYSGALAVYYLFLNEETRPWQVESGGSISAK